MPEGQSIHVEVEARPRLEMPALQGRLLLKDNSFLNPKNKVEAPKLSKDTIDPFNKRDYSVVEKASLRERKSQWGGEKEFSAQYNEWSTHTVKTMNNEANQKKLDMLTPILARAGIKSGDWGAQDVQALYDRYLDNTQPDSGIKQFVIDVIAAATHDGVVDMKFIAQNRESLVWMSKIFGAQSSQVVDQLLLAESSLASDPEAYFEQVNKWINDVTEPEEKLMEFIWNGSAPLSADKKKTTEPSKLKDGEKVIMQLKEPIKDALRDPNVDNIVVSAGTGAGKTTEIPKFVRDILKPGEKLAVTQPRRNAVDRLSQRIADELGIELDQDVIVGEEIIGKAHGGEKLVQSDTQMTLTVEGSLLRKLLRDEKLLEYNYVMIDEWHERHTDTDNLVPFLLRAQKLRKAAGDPPLKLIITSATIDGENLKKQLGDKGVALFNIEGDKRYQIEESFEDVNSAPMDLNLMPARAAKQSQKVIELGIDRPILIFMPGERRIQDTIKELEALGLKDTVISPYYGALNDEEKKQAMVTNDGKRHIIIASPIAETSLTFDTDPFVISSGYVNLPKVDPETGLEYLPEVLHSKAGITQQKGRTGRNEDGYFHFLGTEAEYKKLVAAHPAEITRTDLSESILLYKSMGVEMADLNIIDQADIPPKNIDRAMRRLKALGALDANGNLTKIGKRMSRFPLEIHYKRMLYEAEQRHVVESAASAIVMASQTSLYQRIDRNDKQLQAAFNISKRGFQISDRSDFINLLNVYRQYQKVGAAIQDEDLKIAAQKKWCAEHFLRYDTLVKVETERTKLLSELGMSTVTNDNASTEEVERCIVSGFRDNIMTQINSFVAQGNGKQPSRTIYHYKFAEEPVSNATIDRNSVVNPTQYQHFVSAGNNVRQGDKTNTYMLMNQGVPDAWISQI